MSFPSSFFLGESCRTEERLVLERLFLGCTLLRGGRKEAHLLLEPAPCPPACQQQAGILQ